MIVINLKNYKTGKDALSLCKKIEKNIKEAVVCVSALDIALISSKTKLKVYAQHVDFREGKRNTGDILPEAVRGAGGVGTLINHSEHPLKMWEIKKTIERCKKTGIHTIVCSSSLRQAKKISKYKPDYIAYEEPRLISTGKSITEENPKGIERFVKLMKKKKVKAVCGAGISSAEDVKKSRDFGCYGVLIASAIADSKNPDKMLKEISKIK